MDDIVKQARAKWPNVPHCYGWLALDARGAWRLRDERMQKLNLAGGKITNAAIMGFINRNYTHDGQGRWYFQNGPQRVYVDLEATPYIARTDPTHGFMLQTCEPLAIIDAVWLSEQGNLLLQGEGKIAQVDDRDIEPCIAAIRLNNAPLPDHALIRWLADLSLDWPVLFLHRHRSIPVLRILQSDIPTKFGFVLQPRAPES